MRTLVILSAVLAAATARPGPEQFAQPPVPVDTSSMSPTARTNGIPSLEANDGYIEAEQTGSSLQNPVPDLFNPSSPVNPTKSNTFPVSDDSDSSTDVLHVDNPHMGLPLGSVLPLSDLIESHLESLANTRVDSPHAGLPVSSSISDSPDSTITDSNPTGTFETSPSFDAAFGNSPHNSLSGVPSQRGSVSELLISKFPASLTNSGSDLHFSSFPKTSLVNGVPVGFSDVVNPNSFATDNTKVFFHVSNPISHVPSSADHPFKSDSASFPTNNGNIGFLISNPFGGTHTKSSSPIFLSKTPSAFFTPSSSHGLYFNNLPVNRAISNPQSSSTQNDIYPAVIIKGPVTYEPTNIALTTRNPPFRFDNTNVPLSNPSSSLSTNRHNVLLFSDKVPFGNVNTAQGAVLVGGPSNVATFHQQPYAGVNQVVAVHRAHSASAASATPGVSPVSGHAISWSPDTIFLAGVPVSLGDSNVH